MEGVQEGRRAGKQAAVLEKTHLDPIIIGRLDTPHDNAHPLLSAMSEADHVTRL